MPSFTQRRRPAYGQPHRNINQRSSSSRGRGGKEYIHPSKFVKAAKLVTAEVYSPHHMFTDFAAEPLIIENLTKNNFVIPTPIQDQAIPEGLAGKDIVGIANTGTGKTIAFAIPVLQKLMTEPKSRALIMAPTRELAQQIEVECRVIAKGSGLGGAVLIGGAAMGPQLRDLRSNPQIVIGTPGRIKDHIERGTLTLTNFNVVVLDEVDRMLDMGFIVDMRFILERLASPRQSFFFSATMDAKVSSLLRDFVSDPVTISVKTGDTSENVEQDIVPYTARDNKLDILHDILLKESVSKALIFDDTQRAVERLSHELVARGFKADAIHGGKTQGQRQRALDRFKRDEITILVATDVAARGIDVSGISHVINFSTPNSYQDYVHRVGRAGRAGHQGFALTFVQA